MTPGVDLPSGQLGARAARQAPLAKPGGGRPTRTHEGPPPGQPRRVGYLYILPGFLVYLGFALIPLWQAVWLSFFNWDGVTPAVWAGLSNYRTMLTDPELISAFVHSAVLIFFYSFLSVSLGLVLAASLSRVRIIGISAFRAVLFVPQVLPMVAVAIAWRLIYAPTGPLNQSLQILGLGFLRRYWLGDFTWALPSIGVVGTWVMYGLCMVLFLSGIQKIPSSLYDAARIDGAGPIGEFFAVTLPGLRNEIVVAAVLTIITALRNFDLVYVMTSGGPGNATDVPAFEVYVRAFEVGQIGSAAAVGTVLALIIFGVTFSVSRLGQRRAA